MSDEHGIGPDGVCVLSPHFSKPQSVLTSTSSYKGNNDLQLERISVYYNETGGTSLPSSSFACPHSRLALLQKQQTNTFPVLSSWISSRVPWTLFAVVLLEASSDPTTLSLANLALVTTGQKAVRPFSSWPCSSSASVLSRYRAFFFVRLYRG